LDEGCPAHPVRRSAAANRIGSRLRRWPMFGLHRRGRTRMLPILQSRRVIVAGALTARPTSATSSRLAKAPRAAVRRRGRPDDLVKLRLGPAATWPFAARASSTLTMQRSTYFRR
jgi:hypothetical protein